MKIVTKKILLAFLSSIIVSACGTNSNINAPEQVNINSWSSGDIDEEQPVLNNTTIKTQNNNASLLIDKEQIFPEIYKVIDQAKKKIYLTTYLFGDSVGHTIAEKLVAKKKAGIEVKVVVEETMGLLPELVNPAKKEYEFLAQNGVEVRFFPVELMPKGPTFLANQKVINHSKMVLVDEKLAIMGGMNYKDTEAINHDYMVKIEGPAVKEFTKITDNNWDKSKPRPFNNLVNLQLNNTIINPIPTESPNAQVGTSRIEIAQTGFQDQSIDDMIIRHIYNAKNSIDIEMLLMDHQDVVTALVEAKKRGVNVRIIIDEVEFGKYNKLLDKLPLEGMANFSSVTALTEAGVPVRWYNPTIKDRFLHAKTALFDKQTLIIGSANFTYHALTRNHEVSIALTSPEVSTKFSQSFENDWNNFSKPAQLTKTQKTLGKMFRKVIHMIYNNNSEDEIKSAISLLSKTTQE